MPPSSPSWPPIDDEAGLVGQVTGPLPGHAAGVPGVGRGEEVEGDAVDGGVSTDAWVASQTPVPNTTYGASHTMPARRSPLLMVH